MTTSPRAVTVAQAFHATVKARANHPALRDHRGDVAGPGLTTARACATALLGSRASDARAATRSPAGRTGPSHVADTAAAHLGLGSLSIYPSSTADEAAYVIADARCRVLATEKSFLDRALQVRASGTTRLQTIVCLDGGNETTLSWQELIECEQQEFDLGAAAAAVTPDDLLTVIYNIGTDGPPRLVRLTHADVIARVVALRERLALGDGWRGFLGSRSRASPSGCAPSTCR